jgi:hypothetical protein
MDLLDIRFVAWGGEEDATEGAKADPKVDSALLDRITAMILEKLQTERI